MYNVTMRYVRVTIVGTNKTVSIAYSEWVFVACVFQYAMSMRHIAICGLSDPTVFVHIIS
jgi:hypothetical protein